jgi:hypothetical protein
LAVFINHKKSLDSLRNEWLINEDINDFVMVWFVF